MQQQPYSLEHKGTLLPGQTISVNKYTVQVERYLSQGGFSYVYLVRTATPVYNTTHHVLKRIAVQNEAMLTEVKKEVDIMRILKGHPNIVHLIDAAWHRMSNGQYEVFILMEFCPGGGIIDMMNRRLRERLTEAEILQIFVDVLEGVAAMHNLRPALLHRDLKVENILQSSSTSFKLCDFGSATSVAPRPPSTTQEIRALEADLNRHTTLQYRPPEMIDPYLRRPIDEKSDIWALGVLLYKLCYYTTPFEEHGPLAILNVQYRIPPYPVYSPQLNALIVSMLREHGAHRPSVFELLAQVHRMRGTKSRFTYHIVPQQPLSPRALQSQSATALDNLVSYRPSSSATTQRPPSAKNTGIQARDKVLEAIAPMRRGRPPSQQHDLTPEISKPPTPPKVLVGAMRSPKVDLLDDYFSAEEDSAWRTMKSSATSGEGVNVPGSSNAVMSAWKPKGAARGEPGATWNAELPTSKVTNGNVCLPSIAFGDNFAEKLWDTYDSNRAGPSTTPSISAEKAVPSKIAPPLEGSRTTKLIITKGKDAFEGLGLTSSTPPAPTLGEARKLRTGLAAVNSYNRPAHSPSSTATKLQLTTASAKPTPSPRPSLTHATKISPAIQALSNPISSTATAFPQFGDFSAEARFPSLEELDATMAFSQKPAQHTTQPELNLENQNIIDLSVPSTSSIPLGLQPQHSAAGSAMVQSNSRSERVTTRTAVRETAETLKPATGSETGEGISPMKRPSGRPPSRSSLPAKHATDVFPMPLETQDLLDLTGDSTRAFISPQKTREYKDWLTGDVDTLSSPTKAHGGSDHPETPVLREFTHKRSSFVEENNVHIQVPQEAIPGQQSLEHLTRTSTPPSSSRRNPRSSRSRERKQGTGLIPNHKNLMLRGRPPPASSIQSLNVSQNSTTRSSTRPTPERSSSSDNGKTQPMIESPRDGKLSSSDEESPEDAIGFRTSKSVEKASGPRHKGRQSSVHDLVDLWGGGVVQTRERRKDALPNPSTTPLNDCVTKAPKGRSIGVPSTAKLSTAPPQHLQAAHSGSAEVPRSPSRSPNRRSPNSHMKQMSGVSSTPGTPTATSRGRPQSLLVFPMSKSTSDGKSDTPVTPSGLSVPQDGSRMGGPRRPSITDMVQRYEAIGKVASPGTSPLPKSAVAGTTAATTTGRSLQQSLQSPAVSKSSPSRTLASDDISRVIDTEKRQLFTNPKLGYPRSTENLLDASRSQSSVSGLPTTSSSKLLSQSSSQGGIDGLPSATSLATKAAQPEEEPRSPSPEKPYQGVGKLIDQWQRKSEEASRGPVLKRAFTTRRVGLVGGSVNRDNGTS